MDKKKIIYIGILLIVTVLISVTYFSYAFFTSRIEQHGKLNIVAGTLDYQIESNDLVNNSIVLESNESKTINIKITSLNDINSKYELYYTSNNNIEIGYDNNNDSPTGIINKNESKNLIITIKNKNSNPATVTFGVEGGLISNNLILSIGNSITEIINNNCLYESGYVWDFPFDPDGDGKGQEQVFTVPCDGNYKLEVWGAQGGTSGKYIGGYGGYSEGVINVNKPISLYINVGEGGKQVTNGSINSYNGGGFAKYGSSRIPSSGGGATHIALVFGQLSSLSEHATNGNILIVAGGGGGATYQSSDTCGNGGHGGGYTGANGLKKCSYNRYGTGGSQIAAGEGVGCGSYPGSFGQGGALTSEIISVHSSGGGGGYYGGGADGCAGPGGGGSGYIASSNLISTSDIRKSMYCYGCQEALNTETDSEIFTVSTTGSSSYRDTTNCPNGYSSVAISKCAKAENGYARITYIGD